MAIFITLQNRSEKDIKQGSSQYPCSVELQNIVFGKVKSLKGKQEYSDSMN